MLTRCALGFRACFGSRADLRPVHVDALTLVLRLARVELLRLTLQCGGFGATPFCGVRLFGLLLFFEPRAQLVLEVHREARLLFRGRDRLAQAARLGGRLLRTFERPHQDFVAPRALAFERLDEWRRGLGNGIGLGDHGSAEATTRSLRALGRVLGRSRDHQRGFLTCGDGRRAGIIGSRARGCLDLGERFVAVQPVGDILGGGFPGHRFVACPGRISFDAPDIG